MIEVVGNGGASVCRTQLRAIELARAYHKVFYPGKGMSPFIAQKERGSGWWYIVFARDLFEIAADDIHQFVRALPVEVCE